MTDPLSRRTRLSLANRLTTFYTYDAANRLTKLAFNGALKTFGTFAYTSDATQGCELKRHRVDYRGGHRHSRLRKPHTLVWG